MYVESSITGGAALTVADHSVALCLCPILICSLFASYTCCAVGCLRGLGNLLLGAGTSLGSWVQGRASSTPRTASAWAQTRTSSWPTPTTIASRSLRRAGSSSTSLGCQVSGFGLHLLQEQRTVKSDSSGQLDISPSSKSCISLSCMITDITLGPVFVFFVLAVYLVLSSW